MWDLRNCGYNNEMGRILIALVLLALSAVPATARHLESRTGFGVTLHPYGPIPSLSMHYHMTDYQSAVVMGGVNTDDDQKTLLIGGKLYQNAHLEENLNFYVGLGGFLISAKAGEPTAATGIELDGLFGCEIFLAGLPNLGIQIETGVALRTVRRVSFATLGSGFLGGAVHYYF